MPGVFCDIILSGVSMATQAAPVEAVRVPFFDRDRTCRSQQYEVQDAGTHLLGDIGDAEHPAAIVVQPDDVPSAMPAAAASAGLMRTGRQ
jgi:hypothetical protein